MLEGRGNRWRAAWDAVRCPVRFWQGFLEENGLNGDGARGEAVEVSRDGKGVGGSASLERLQEEVSQPQEPLHESWSLLTRTVLAHSAFMQTGWSVLGRASSFRDVIPALCLIERSEDSPVHAPEAWEGYSW